MDDECEHYRPEFEGLGVGGVERKLKLSDGSYSGTARRCAERWLAQQESARTAREVLNSSSASRASAAAERAADAAERANKIASSASRSARRANIIAIVALIITIISSISTTIMAWPIIKPYLQ